LEAKFGSVGAGEGAIHSISRQGQPPEACRPTPAWQCTLTDGGVPSGGVRGQRPYPPIRTPSAGETVGLSRNPTHWVHPLLPAVFFS
jgi:hypothetical protein